MFKSLEIMIVLENDEEFIVKIFNYFLDFIFEDRLNNYKLGL